METIVKNLGEAGDFLHKIGHQLSSETIDVVRESPLPADLLSAFDQFITLTQQIDRQNMSDFSLDEISDIADQGLNLLGQIYQWVTQKNYQDEVLVVQQTSLLIVKWLIKYHGQLKTMDLVVDTLAALANKLHEPEALTRLSDFMGQVLVLASDEIKQDFDAMNAQRPWRILNLNRSIVATRTHDPDLMRAVFDDLLTYLPQDAEEFFRQGLGEMARLDYPDHVRVVVEEFHTLSQQPRVH